MALQLTAVEFPKGSSLRADLMKYLCRTFRAAKAARSIQMDQNHYRWIKNYAGIPKEEIRTTPFYKASNFVPHLIRIHTDILQARLGCILFGTKPFWRAKDFYLGAKHEWLEQISAWMDFKCFHEIQFFEPLDVTLHGALKTGCLVLNGNWEESVIYEGPQSNQQFQSQEKFECTGLKFEPIRYEDFFPHPVTARNLQQTEATFTWLRFTKEQVQFRKNTTWWDGIAADFLLTSGQSLKLSNGEQAELIKAGITLTPDSSRPYNVIEAQFQFELEPGKLFNLVAVFNPEFENPESLLKLYYSPFKKGVRNLIDFRIFPRDGLFQGYAVPEILEQNQEEKAQIHNSRRDANLIANVPTWKKVKDYEGADPSVEWYPGKVFEVNSMADLDTFTFNTNYNSLIEEEQYIDQLAERATGVSAPQQAYGSGSMAKRNLYANSATLAMMSEGNRRLDWYLHRLRYPFHRLGQLVWYSEKTFRNAETELYARSKDGQIIKQALSLDPPPGLHSFFGLSASDAGANRETDRTSLLLMSNSMASYYGQITQMLPMLGQMPDGPPKELLYDVLDGARDLANRLLLAFDVPDRGKLTPDARRVLTGRSADESPEEGDGTSQPGGLPPAAGGAPGPDQLAELSRNIAALQGSRTPQAFPGNGGGQII